MSEILCVKWTIVTQEPPQPLLHCSRCNRTKAFRTSDKIRVNANGKQIDAWLIYKCTSCDSTWNRSILERQHVRTIEASFLARLRANDPELASRVAFDAEDLRRRVERLEEYTEVAVFKEMLSQRVMSPRQLLVHCVVPHPIEVRVDRILAAELQLSRSYIQALEKSGDLALCPGRSRSLRKPVRDGISIAINLRARRADRIVNAAVSENTTLESS